MVSAATSTSVATTFCSRSKLTFTVAFPWRVGFRPFRPAIPDEHSVEKHGESGCLAARRREARPVRPVFSPRASQTVRMRMIIDRVEVRGGFLDGVDLEFARGLNVLIGARGAGKTSVLELLRFALGVPAMTDDAQRDADRQARAVLGDGTVTVFGSLRGEAVVVSRSSLDEAPSLAAPVSVDPPLIVSQNEIEGIGLDPASRRAILDRLRDPDERADDGSRPARTAVLRLQRQIEKLRAEREEVRDKIAATDGLEKGLAEAEALQSQAAATADQLAPLQDAIATQADLLGSVRSAGVSYQATTDALREWRDALTAPTLSTPLPPLADAAIEKAVGVAVESVESLVARIGAELESAEHLVEDAFTATRAQHEAVHAELRARTDELETIQRGAGEVGQRVAALRQRLAERKALLERGAALDDEITRVRTLRDVALDDLDRTLDQTFDQRRNRASAVTAEFNSRIEVRVDKAGEVDAYRVALAEVLQGSNLQYKALAAEVASSMTPRELVAAVEDNDAQRLVDVAGITADRAARVVAHLRGQALGEVLAAELEDTVDFALLDGQDYKVTRHLSMGQRCTIVLPLLLAEHRESILLDQPEDHLDNAFIVETLVQAIRERAAGGQVIVATHNANIPVLGEARRIIVLASNGRNGFVSVAAGLDDDPAVNAITTLMEGGREAFARRAEFYRAHDA